MGAQRSTAIFRDPVTRTRAPLGLAFHGRVCPEEPDPNLSWAWVDIELHQSVRTPCVGRGLESAASYQGISGYPPPTATNLCRVAPKPIRGRAREQLERCGPRRLSVVQVSASRYLSESRQRRTSGCSARTKAVTCHTSGDMFVGDWRSDIRSRSLPGDDMSYH